MSPVALKMLGRYWAMSRVSKLPSAPAVSIMPKTFSASALVNWPDFVPDSRVLAKSAPSAPAAVAARWVRGARAWVSSKDIPPARKAPRMARALSSVPPPRATIRWSSARNSATPALMPASVRSLKATVAS